MPCCCWNCCRGTPSAHAGTSRLLLSDCQCFTWAGPNQKPLVRKSGKFHLQASRAGSTEQGMEGRVWGCEQTGKQHAHACGILPHGSFETCCSIMIRCDPRAAVTYKPHCKDEHWLSQLLIDEEFPGNYSCLF